MMFNEDWGTMITFSPEQRAFLVRVLEHEWQRLAREMHVLEELGGMLGLPVDEDWGDEAAEDGYTEQ